VHLLEAMEVMEVMVKNGKAVSSSCNAVLFTGSCAPLGGGDGKEQPGCFLKL